MPSPLDQPRSLQEVDRLINEGRAVSRSQARRIVSSRPSSLWLDDSIQFPRLIAEIVATQPLDLDALCESMDLELGDLCELFDRAEEAWTDAKARLA